MIARILCSASSKEVRDRVRRLLDRGGLSCDATEPDRLWEHLSRDDFDLVIAERAGLPPLAKEWVQSLQTLPENPGILILTEDDRAQERAELLASGCLAVLWLGLEDGPLGDALVSLCQRHVESVLRRLGMMGKVTKRSSLDEFVARSPAMQRFIRVARRVVDGDSALLILGETGVGKERLARSIHSESGRAEGPMVTVNCGALPETLLESELFGHEEGAFTGATRARRGYFELAHRGTIFLDEIGELPVHLQVKLLRVLEDRRIQRLGGERPIEVDVRVLAATNRELEQELASRRFRPDLYYRLAVVTLTVPPLRERREDVPELATQFLLRSSRQIGRAATRFSPEAIESLVRYDWPGNVRELINVIERAVLLSQGTEIGVADLRAGEGTMAEVTATTHHGSALGPGPWEGTLERPLSEARSEVLAVFERNYLTRLLAATRGKVGEAARRAGLSTRSLYTLMRRHGLYKEDFKDAAGTSSERSISPPGM